MDIRVPADRYEFAVTAVAAVGKVRERSENGQDLTGDLSDSVARLDNLERTESDMRKIMDRSGSVEQISTSRTSFHRYASRSRRSSPR